MSQTPALLEPSFRDAVAIIAGAQELPEQTRRHWATSLRQIAKALDKPPEVIPARYLAVRPALAVLHNVPAGMTAKTLQNHKSNVKSALFWLTREKGIPRHGAPLTPPWEALWAQVRPSLPKARLSSVIRFCSASSIPPAEVDETVIDRLIAYRSQTGRRGDDCYRRLLARAWNAMVGKIEGWPQRRLIEPPVKNCVEVAWEEFPEGLRRDVDRYLDGLTLVRRSRIGQRIRPLKPVTIKCRRAELSAAARMAVRIGVPIHTLTSLSALLAPATAEKILDAYWAQNGEKPKLFTIYLASRFFQIASETKCVDEAACDRLDELRRAIEDHRIGGLTDKNIALIRQVLTPGVWSRTVNLPLEMMAAARSHHSHSPGRTAVTAQLAVSIAILTVAPVRLANLVAIKLGFNLIKPDGPDSNYWLVFPDYDVKNRVKLEFPLGQYLTRMIDEYVHEFRPALLRGKNEDWLFPGRRIGAKDKSKFSGQISQRIFKATGLHISVHQFRHAAAAIILQRRPGEYEIARRLLGHRNVQTTINFYVGLENIHASEIFGKIVMEHMHDELEPAE